MFNEICINEEMLPIYIYIYIYINNIVMWFAIFIAKECSMLIVDTGFRALGDCHFLAYATRSDDYSL